MRRILLAGVLVAACASAPAPRAPDESHRVPVNQVVPPELSPEDPRENPEHRAHRGAEVEWR